MRLSQRAYTERILKMFKMQSCSSGKAPILKGDRFSKGQERLDESNPLFFSCGQPDV